MSFLILSISLSLSRSYTLRSVVVCQLWPMRLGTLLYSTFSLHDEMDRRCQLCAHVHRTPSKQISFARLISESAYPCYLGRAYTPSDDTSPPHSHRLHTHENQAQISRDVKISRHQLDEIRCTFWFVSSHAPFLSSPIPTPTPTTHSNAARAPSWLSSSWTGCP